MPDNVMNASAEALALQRKMIYSTSDVKLAMKILLGLRADAEQVRRSFFGDEDGKKNGPRFIPINDETVDWAYHVLDRMVYEPSWRVQFG